MKLTSAFRTDTPFRRRMAQGHLLRRGHILVGFYVIDQDSDISRLIRTCCGEKP